MTELPIQITRLPVHPQVRPSIKPANTNSNATGNEGFKLSILTSAKPDRHCCLVFRNFYVAWIRIVQVNVDGSSTELASNYPLMQHVHCEDDAQNWQLIKLDKLPVSWNPHVLDSLSRSALVRNNVAVDTTPIEEHATRCLDIVLRLRELLQN
ncbi:hypothetical protein BBJ29_006236 [Phytophthora kernoviae]|uniref:Uncharacterized protein n=1 Tax=Phytophthora kernoviae TaxID=325452 RepID=A0A3F2RIX2_9STRA|nr:hypothetical protein BBP00_00007914 [Phytophthora kernoviae]RLN71367.1 hypothetical protein BBJ29_006236 [Phytophthora kernoviae]